MPRYTYTAIAKATGREEQGTIEGMNRMEAIVAVRLRGLAPVRVEPAGSDERDRGAGPSLAHARGLGRKRAGRRWSLSRRPGRRALTQFTRQLATLVNAKLPLTRSLEVLARQERNPSFQRVLRDLSAAIGAGGNFSDGLLQHPACFDPLFVNMVKAGEAGGVLGTVLERLAHFMEKSERLKARVKSAMIYPVIIMAVAAAILAVLMIFVVPKFEQIFAGLLKGQPLPLATRSLLAASHFIGQHILACAGAGTLVWAVLRLVRRTRLGVRGVDWLLIRLPVVGELALKAAIARFTRTLGSLVASGVSLLEAMVITRTTAGNVHIAAALDHVHERVKQGDTIAGPLEATAIFPDMVTGMIQVGEETGALSEMLARIADTYDEEVDTAVAGLTSIIEPIMIVLMALVVGVIVIALFLPIVGIIQHLQ